MATLRILNMTLDSDGKMTGTTGPWLGTCNDQQGSAADQEWQSTVKRVLISPHPGAGNVSLGHAQRMDGQGEQVGRAYLVESAWGETAEGVARGQEENANLRAFQKENAVTAAESIKTCQTEAFYGREYVEVVERLCDKKEIKARAIFGERETTGTHGSVKSHCPMS